MSKDQWLSWRKSKKPQKKKHCRRSWKDDIEEKKECGTKNRRSESSVRIILGALFAGRGGAHRNWGVRKLGNKVDKSQLDFQQGMEKTLGDDEGC